MVGDTCRTIKHIEIIGYRHFNLRRHEHGKEVEVKKVVMAEMRAISGLYLKFQEVRDTNILFELVFEREHPVIPWLGFQWSGSYLTL